MQGSTFHGFIRIAAPNSVIEKEGPDEDVVKIFPNPTADLFKLFAIFTRQQRVTVEVIDFRGVIVYTRQYDYVDQITDSFDLSSAATSMYLVKLTTESGFKTLKVVKQ